MRELIELQTGQVAFISGLMSGFALTVAVHVLRYGIRSRVAQVVFLMLMVTSLLFLVALYVDVRLTIEMAGIDSMEPSLAHRVAEVRVIGTTSATVALFMFVVAIGLLGWLASPATGVLGSLLTGMVMFLLYTVWTGINELVPMLSSYT